MTGEECLQTIKDLSHSQGMYGRLLAEINDLDDDTRKELLDSWQERNFKDRVDFILYLENGE